MAKTDSINNLDNHTGFYLQPFTDRLEVRYLDKGRAVSFIMIKWEDFGAMRQKATQISPVVEIPNAFYRKPFKAFIPSRHLIIENEATNG